MLGGGMPSETLGPRALSLRIRVFLRTSHTMTFNMCCLVRRSATAYGGPGSDSQRAGAQRI
eukprot:1004456-Pleurochrysis_carterae.AAC.1